MGIFSFLKRNINNKVVICGLDSSGKSTMISFLKEGRFVEHTPTMGKEKTELEIQGTKINLFDMGGQSNFRDFWLGEMKGAKCVIFVIDKAARNRYAEARVEFEKLIPYIQKSNIALIFIANKYDLAPDDNLGEIISYFNLYALDNFGIFQTSAKTGYGMADTFAKIYSNLTGKVIRKTILAKAVSIWNKSGIPLVTHTGTEEFEQKVIEGGFMSAITTFADLKLDSNSITFKSEKNGTYIILRSNNYIGSLLWNKDLSVPIEESEEALKELLDHLELNGQADGDKIIETVQHYCTNLM